MRMLAISAGTTPNIMRLLRARHLLYLSLFLLACHMGRLDMLGVTITMSCAAKVSKY